MRLLTALALASGALALATGPVQHPADHQTVEGDALLNPENAVLATEITTRDETVSSSEVDKRMPGVQASIRIPRGPADPTTVTIAGITVTFIVAQRWIKKAGKGIMEFSVKSVTFANDNAGKKVVQAVAKGATFFSMRMARNVQRFADVPSQGPDAFTLIVTAVDDEL
ncbi:hypothetical protein E4U32_005664 [Claviceps aff. humidiphila group G2b]|nr:hypothetical protein E4U32_005664 [Claviceps aff. humidiphila group G2b]KAG6090729.1 hypothetical protein E4U31_007790 [Claviceps sp. LM219 group G6]